MLWPGMLGPDGARPGRRGQVRQGMAGKAWRGKAWQGRLGTSWRDTVRYG